ncbi:kinase-like domain-containing protein [Thamnocephalis sphaerospora]|uniref:non-specific serine/threonine protein kinase n=1 Tax=Thamnocephalis sphaerospora TaxID=78915 RepID=A0A4P9XRH7_9FUNG|nr:kinase-like domain-containing protein [Thamnocephalis sphaerospora]|eukprot:RKP08685.1 kinase-like domain-containing protein [Thamnocephalis sphaerospora]
MDKYEPLEIVGRGSFGVIRKIRRVADGQLFVRKEIDYRLMSEKERRQMVNEVNILNNLKHPNIVRYHERHVDRDERRIYIVMEYCSGGDLAAIIKHFKARNQRIPEDTVWQLVAQMMLALHECHQGRTVRNAANGTESRVVILHRDLKPDNIFLDEHHNVKLGDFGLSREMACAHEMFAKTYVGTPFYMSPELVTGSTYDAKSDIWSLGCIIYEVCALRPPFLATNQMELNNKILSGNVPPLPREYSSDLARLVTSMLSTKPDMRPTTACCLSHPRIQTYMRNVELTQAYVAS